MHTCTNTNPIFSVKILTLHVPHGSVKDTVAEWGIQVVEPLSPPFIFSVQFGDSLKSEMRWHFGDV